MRELQDRRRWRRLFYSKITIIILLVILIMLGRAVWGMYEKNKIAAYYRDRSERELADLKQRAVELSASVSRLKTERGVEEEIRKNFSVVKEDEFVITVVDPESPKTDQSEKSGGAIKNFWHWLADLF